MIIQICRDTLYCYDVLGIHPAVSPQVPCKSKGQHRFSLLVFTVCSSGCSSGMGWAYSLLWCLLILSWMTSLTWGMLKCVCRVRFVTHRIAFAVALRILDLDLCMVTVFDLLAQPTVLFRCSVKVGRRVIYFLQIDGNLFPNNQLICFVFKSICFLFFFGNVIFPTSPAVKV